MAASATTGVLNPLLAKLGQLLGEEYKKLTGVRKQASFRKDELSAMIALLDKMELMDKLDPSAKNWRDHIREMSYDMENCIDDFIHDIEGANAKKGFVRKMAQRLRRLGRRHQIANRIEEANARRERYRIDDCINSSYDTVVVDPRMTAIYKEATGLVGIDDPREELVSLLMDSKKKLKVVSIVGFGGLGKTTLASKVYDEIGGQFNCMAFVSVSQKPNVKNLLNALQFNIGIKDSSHVQELQDIINRLREHLKHMRYFIVVDDLWDEPTWNIISCAFPENANGSRVMVTTRLEGVAVKACGNDDSNIYRMKHLEEKYSRRLFCNRVFGSENVCPPQFEEILAEILKKCGGLPLSIITISSLLASQEARLLNEWEIIKNSLGAKFATKPTLEEMRGILNLSYMHLPVHLRPCFLYLGMYPEDREILRDDLVRQWIAEGFVCSLHGDLDGVAISYFNELINRSLIQPEKTHYGEVLSCRVHDMMLDLILSKCAEDNFIIVAYDNEDMERLHRSEYKVRRLSLKSSVDGATSNTLITSMSQVRSYARFGESLYTAPLSQLKYLRVLLFEFPYQWDTIVDLTAIGHLFLLRYLKVSAISADVALPAEIQGLVHLETLDLQCNPTQSFPSDITCLVNLFHLVLPYGTVLPEGIHNMKSVGTLHCSGISESSLDNIVVGLSELTSLKELTLRMPYRKCLTAEQVDALVFSIGMLRGLRQLSLKCHHEWDGNDRQLESLPDPPPSLEVLDLAMWEFGRVPKWIGELRCLRVLSLHVLHLSNDEVCVLGELSFLVHAWLHVSKVSQDKVVVGTRLFPVMEYFAIRSDEDVTAYLSFEAGGMPMLQTLILQFCWKEWRGATPVGMEFLTCLRDIRVWLKHTSGVSGKNGQHISADVESAFKRAARVRTRHPSVSVTLLAG
ncbi:hypothetical protein ACQJBY_039051 [Aegilops geniculata]